MRQHHACERVGVLVDGRVPAPLASHDLGDAQLTAAAAAQSAMLALVRRDLGDLRFALGNAGRPEISMGNLAIPDINRLLGRLGLVLAFPRLESNQIAS